MEGIEIEGKTIDEAIEKACREFQVPREKLNIEIVAEGNPGFLGLGAKKARIRAGLFSIDMTLDAVFSRTESSAPVRTEKFVATVPEGNGAGSRAAGNGPKFAAPTLKERPAVRPAATRPLAKTKAPEYAEHGAGAKPHPALSAVDDGVPAAEKSKWLLEGLLTRMELTSPVTVEETEEAIILNIQGDGSGLLIGKRGQNLDAIQYIVNKAVHKTANGHKMIVIDTEEYRKRREESLVALAVRLGEKVKKTKKPVTVGHMNAHDRRVIHMAMQNDETLATKSRGEGEYRKIMILPARRGRIFRRRAASRQGGGPDPMTSGDTIAAIATPPGIGGVGLIRISGPAAEGIAQRLFRPLPPADFLSHHIYHGEIVSPETGAVLDEVLIAFLKGPRSYTGEDTLEISCHGGPLILRTVLEEVLRAGARPAERGEFTKRAFLNDRLDLVQAEAVLDIITAQTRPGLAAAVGRLQGKLSGRVESIRSEIIDLLAGIEAAIDFFEEDGVGETPDSSHFQIQHIIDRIASLAATYHQGRIYREGIGVVIAGRPNVGKSSLLNRLLGEKRAIVTSIPGTTRDFIEETVDLGGIPVRLTDTAGLRPPENAIEQEAIDLVWERLETTDAVLVLLDGSADLTADDRDLLAKMTAKPLLPVLNKSDLPPRLDEESLKGLLPEGTRPTVRISAKYGDGIDRLTAAIRDLVITTSAEEASEVMIAHLHHKTTLEKAAAGLVRARDGLQGGLQPELVALEVREALDALGEITGRTTQEEVLDRIFANFCIGK